MLRDVIRGRLRRDPPTLSIVVNFYNNRREAANTLYSLTRHYQRNIENLRYEVIAVDNGSQHPLSEADVRAFGPEFGYRFVATKSVSPVGALNAACRDAAGEYVMVLIDGAHIVTPGIVALACEAFSRFAAPFVATVPFQLGPTKQNLSVLKGYNQDVEDRLLEACGWKANGYRLYAASASLADESGGWYGQLFESSCFAMRRADFLALGGYDERFQSRGGGLANLDFFQRALATPRLDYVVLLGEATFHQVHGGVSTSVSMNEHPWEAFNDEYAGIRGHRFTRVPRRPIMLGDVPKEAEPAVEFSKRIGADIWSRFPSV